MDWLSFLVAQPTVSKHWIRCDTIYDIIGYICMRSNADVSQLSLICLMESKIKKTQKNKEEKLKIKTDMLGRNGPVTVKLKCRKQITDPNQWPGLLLSASTRLQTRRALVPLGWLSDAAHVGHGKPDCAGEGGGLLYSIFCVVPRKTVKALCRAVNEKVL